MKKVYLSLFLAAIIVPIHAMDHGSSDTFTPKRTLPCQEDIWPLYDKIDLPAGQQPRDEVDYPSLTSEQSCPIKFTSSLSGIVHPNLFLNPDVKFYSTRNEVLLITSQHLIGTRTEPLCITALTSASEQNKPFTHKLMGTTLWKHATSKTYLAPSLDKPST